MFFNLAVKKRESQTGSCERNHEPHPQFVKRVNKCVYVNYGDMKVEACYAAS